MKKRVNYITIAILAFYIGVPLMIGAANILTLQSEQNELRQMLRKANLGISFHSITTSLRRFIARAIRFTSR